MNPITCGEGECRHTLRLITMQYSGKRQEEMLKAWKLYPTLKTHCPEERRLMERMRKYEANKHLKEAGETLIKL